MITSILLIALIFTHSLFAQNQLSPAKLFQQARAAAYDKKNYALATKLSKNALKISPDYADVRIFTGSVYTWWGKVDSARIYFTEALSKYPGNEDASSAYADMEYWNKNSFKAISIIEEGLTFHSKSPNPPFMIG